MLASRVEEDTDLIEDEEDVHAVAAYYAGTCYLDTVGSL
jgi:hypothetical protein